MVENGLDPEKNIRMVGGTPERATKNNSILLIFLLRSKQIFS
jgi:hypothetical protein